MSKDVEVLIVGAGPTGLTLACELARYGVSFRIIDKEPHASEKSKALAVHSRSLEVFEDMGIVDRFLTFGLKMRGINIFADSKQIAHMTFDELDGPYSFALTLPQSDTERILMERLAELGAQVERSITLIGMTQGKDCVENHVRNADGQEGIINSRYTVGTDGAHSAVRKALNMDFSGEKYPDLMYLNDVHIEGAINPDEIYVFNSDHGILALFPYGGGRYRIACSMGEEQDQAEALKSVKEPSIDEMQAEVDRRSPYSLVLSEQFWSCGIYLHRRHVKQYRKGNCFLAGDAAHIHSPAGGQGMNTGIQDSYNLAWKLALVTKGKAEDMLLDSYGVERLGIALGVLKMTDFMMKVNTLKNPVAKHLRNTLAPVLTAHEVIQKRMQSSIAELSLNYRESPIVEEHHSSMIDALAHKNDMPNLEDCFAFKNGPQAGDRAPDGFVVAATQGPLRAFKRGDAYFPPSQLAGTTRLFELFQGTKHTLLLFSGDETSNEEIDIFGGIARALTNAYSDLVNVVAIVDSDDSRNKCTPHFEKVLKTHAPEMQQHVMVVEDWEMSCHHKYGAGANCLYLIRPDGYVGFRSQPVAHKLLTKYLERIFDKVQLARI